LENLALVQARWEANRENLILDSTSEAVAELPLFREAGAIPSLM